MIDLYSYGESDAEMERLAADLEKLSTHRLLAFYKSVRLSTLSGSTDWDITVTQTFRRVLETREHISNKRETRKKNP